MRMRDVLHMHCTFSDCIKRERRERERERESRDMSTSTKRDQKKELAIYDPEGLEPEADLYEEVKVPLQDHVTNTRLAMQHTWSSLQEAWTRTTEDTRKSLISAATKTRKQTDATLSSLGLGDRQQVLRGSAYAGAALTGLYLARRRSMLAKIIYPLLGVGLVGGAFHRHDLHNHYKKALESGGFQGNWMPWQPGKFWKGSESEGRSRWRGSAEEGRGKEK